MTRIRKRTLLTARQLTTHQLTKIYEDDIGLDLDDILSKDPDHRGSSFFLGFYSTAGIKYALEKYGVFEKLKKMGFGRSRLEVSTGDPYQQRISIYEDDRRDSHLLVEVVLKRYHHTVTTPFPSRVHGRSYEFIYVEWLALQNPFKKFSADRPRLPGQTYPGLGESRMVFELLMISCKRMRMAGLLAVPEYYHNAEMYSKAFFYLNPGLEGKRRAISRDLLTNYNLAEASWAIDLDCVTENGKPFKWFTGEAVIPMDRDLKEYIHSQNYQKLVDKAEAEHHYAVNTDCWNKKKKTIDNFVS